MAQPSSPDYPSSDMRESTEGIMDQVSEIGERAGTMANEFGALRSRSIPTQR